MSAERILTATTDDLQDHIRVVVAANERLKAQLETLRKQNTELHTNVIAETARHKLYTMDAVEISGVRRSGTWWWLALLFLLFVCLDGVHTKAIKAEQMVNTVYYYGLTVVNFAAFLLVWRRLYVPRNATYTGAAFLVAVVTLIVA